MAIFKATYTKQGKVAKKAINYICHRRGKEGAKVTRTLFGGEGKMSKQEAHALIDGAEGGSLFYRFVLSPDPAREDVERDLHLGEITQRTMQILEERLHKKITFVAVEHADHAPHRHVHIIAIVPERLNVQDFQLLRSRATQVSLEQRQQLDLARQERARSQATSPELADGRGLSW